MNETDDFQLCIKTLINFLSTNTNFDPKLKFKDLKLKNWTKNSYALSAPEKRNRIENHSSQTNEPDMNVISANKHLLETIEILRKEKRERPPLFELDITVGRNKYAMKTMKVLVPQSEMLGLSKRIVVKPLDGGETKNFKLENKNQLKDMETSLNTSKNTSFDHFEKIDEGKMLQDKTEFFLSQQKQIYGINDQKNTKTIKKAPFHNDINIIFRDDDSVISSPNTCSFTKTSSHCFSSPPSLNLKQASQESTGSTFCKENPLVKDFPLLGSPVYLPSPRKLMFGNHLNEKKSDCDDYSEVSCGENKNTIDRNQQVKSNKQYDDDNGRPSLKVQEDVAIDEKETHGRSTTTPSAQCSSKYHELIKKSPEISISPEFSLQTNQPKKDIEIDFYISEIKDDIDLFFNEKLTLSHQNGIRGCLIRDKYSDIEIASFKMTGEKLKSALCAISNTLRIVSRENSVGLRPCKMIQYTNPVNIDEQGFPIESNDEENKFAISTIIMPASSQYKKRSMATEEVKFLEGSHKDFVNSANAVLWYKENKEFTSLRNSSENRHLNVARHTSFETPPKNPTSNDEERTNNSTIHPENLLANHSENHHKKMQLNIISPTKMTPIKSPLKKIETMEQGARKRINMLRKYLESIIYERKFNQIPEISDVARKLDFVEIECMRQMERLREDTIRVLLY